MSILNDPIILNEDTAKIFDDYIDAPTNGPKNIWLYGFGGNGKSSFLIKYFESRRDEFESVRFVYTAKLMGEGPGSAFWEGVIRQIKIDSRRKDEFAKRCHEVSTILSKLEDHELQDHLADRYAETLEVVGAARSMIDHFKDQANQGRSDWERFFTKLVENDNFPGKNIRSMSSDRNKYGAIYVFSRFTITVLNPERRPALLAIDNFDHCRTKNTEDFHLPIFLFACLTDFLELCQSAELVEREYRICNIIAMRTATYMGLFDSFFREFNSSFLSHFDIDEQKIEKIRHNNNETIPEIIRNSSLFDKDIQEILYSIMKRSARDKSKKAIRRADPDPDDHLASIVRIFNGDYDRIRRCINASQGTIKKAIGSGKIFFNESGKFNPKFGFLVSETIVSIVIRYAFPKNDYGTPRNFIDCNYKSAQYGEDTDSFNCFRLISNVLLNRSENARTRYPFPKQGVGLMKLFEKSVELLITLGYTDYKKISDKVKRVLGDLLHNNVYVDSTDMSCTILRNINWLRDTSAPYFDDNKITSDEFNFYFRKLEDNSLGNSNTTDELNKIRIFNNPSMSYIKRHFECHFENFSLGICKYLDFGSNAHPQDGLELIPKRSRRSVFDSICTVHQPLLIAFNEKSKVPECPPETRGIGRFLFIHLIHLVFWRAENCVNRMISRMVKYPGDFLNGFLSSDFSISYRQGFPGEKDFYFKFLISRQYRFLLDFRDYCTQFFDDNPNHEDENLSKEEFIESINTVLRRYRRLAKKSCERLLGVIDRESGRREFAVLNALLKFSNRQGD